MKVFVTGASGFIGSAVVQELLRAGHKVTGLARSEASAELIAKAGAQVHRGELSDLESLRRGAVDADGVIHLGFNHDFSKFQENCEVDRRAIETFGEVLAGSHRPLVVTSGLAGLAKPGETATEDMTVDIQAEKYPRVSEGTALNLLAKKKVNASVVRLAPAVHGDGSSGFRAGFVSVLSAIAMDKGFSAYIGDGLNRWPGVHRLDAATLFRLAVEKGIAGARYHAVENEGTPLKDIATAIGKKLNVPVRSISPEESVSHFAWFGGFAAIGMPASSKITRERLGWKPTQLELLPDFERATITANDRY